LLLEKQANQKLRMQLEQQALEEQQQQQYQEKVIKFEEINKMKRSLDEQVEMKRLKQLQQQQQQQLLHQQQQQQQQLLLQEKREFGEHEHDLVDFNKVSDNDKREDRIVTIVVVAAAVIIIIIIVVDDDITMIMTLW
jgi:hypothetical protein